MTERPWDLRIARWLSPGAPVVVAMLVVAAAGQLGGDDPGWAGFFRQIGLAGIMLLPSLAAHIASGRVRPEVAIATWLAGFVVYPVVIAPVVANVGAGRPELPVFAWPVAAAFSLSFLLLHPSGRRASGVGGSGRTRFGGLRVTLDGVVLVLLALWVLGATSLFASTPDAVHNQPLKVWIDGDRLLAHPGEAAWYLWQFGTVALLLYGWYLLCRRVLVRGIFRAAGVMPFCLAVIALVAVGPPLAASIALFLPLNVPEWTILPSENHNPFDPHNYRFGLWLTLVLIPVILVIERLLDERTRADGRHAAVRAELDQLREQINPHFLFNTLNTLYSLCLEDRTDTAAAIVKLSDLLRYVVYRGDADRVGMAEEIDYVRNYLDLQMLRFGHRCTLRCDWPDPTREVVLPPLMLIMLVENAFKHGVEPAGGHCDIRIAMRVDADRLCFECRNSLAPAARIAPPAGRGLANLRRRLELLFGADFRLDSAAVGDEWHARLELDLRAC